MAARASEEVATAPQQGWLGRPGTDEGRDSLRARHDGDAEPDAFKPGEHEDARFELGDSVAFWRAWTPAESVGPAVAHVARQAAATGDVPYWAYHLARSSWFLGTGALGLAATAVATRGARIPDRSALGAGARAFEEALATFERDHANIRAGKYNAPYDMDPRHRQFDPVFVLDRSARFVREAVGTLKRRAAGEPEPVWLRSPLYPEYYLNTFHYQSDGWLSSESAKVYETSTEALFLGRQDAMQRHALLPLAAFMRGRDQAKTRLLEIGCGTGRFHTFLKDSHPGLSTVALDLSPYYLQEARDNHAQWLRLRGAKHGAVGPTEFVQAPAEDVPAEEFSFDAVVCVYMFHELPDAARDAVVREAARVVKPNGIFILADSIQLGDRPALDANLGRFGDFNEPYYRSYIATDLVELFGRHGFEPEHKELASSTKVLSFRRRATSPEVA